MSADGRFVVLTSDATQLTATLDGNHVTDVFVHDTTAGTTTLVSVNAAGNRTANNVSNAPSITPDGRYVVFLSRATDLITAPTDTNNAADVFVRDLMLKTTTLVSINAAGTAAGNGASENPRITPDGRFVVFDSAASDLVPPSIDTNGKRDVFLRDLVMKTTTLISVDSTGAASATGNSFAPYISTNGVRIAFQSTASDLLAGTVDANGVDDVYLRDLAAGTTQLVSVNQGGASAGDAASQLQGLSADGHAVLFTSDASDLVAGDANAAIDVFVRDTNAATTTLVSINVNGTGAGDGSSQNPVMTPDGTVVAFESNAGDLVDGFIDANGSDTDVFVRDLTSQSTRLASINRPPPAAITLLLFRRSATMEA